MSIENHLFADQMLILNPFTISLDFVSKQQKEISIQFIVSIQSIKLTQKMLLQKL